MHVSHIDAAAQAAALSELEPHGSLGLCPQPKSLPSFSSGSARRRTKVNSVSNRSFAHGPIVKLQLLVMNHHDQIREVMRAALANFVQANLSPNPG